MQEVVESMMRDIKRLSPAEQALFAYNLQVGIGGFPRDSAGEERIRKALADENRAKIKDD
jgi:hypothetical protein